MHADAARRVGRRVRSAIGAVSKGPLVTAVELRSDPVKPRMRGVLHHHAALVAAGAGLVVVALAPSARAAFAAAVHAASLVTLLAVSATYHRVNWGPEGRAWMRRADHAAIFLLIAGTYTGVGVLALPSEIARKMLSMVWLGAAAGVLQSLFWVRAPKPLIVVLYLALGWAIVPFMGAVHRAMTPLESALLYTGGLTYTVGAITYGVKKPNPLPGVFGYHEVFHALTLVACSTHFAMLLSLVRRAG